jgi:hypothetical protein
MNHNIYIPSSLDIELTLADTVQRTKASSHRGFEETALEGISLALEVANKKRIKIVVNGGAVNPKGLAEEVTKIVLGSPSQCVLEGQGH